MGAFNLIYRRSEVSDGKVTTPEICEGIPLTDSKSGDRAGPSASAVSRARCCAGARKERNRFLRSLAGLNLVRLRNHGVCAVMSETEYRVVMRPK